MSDDPFAQIMRDRGLGDVEVGTDEVPLPALPADYVARVRALELSGGALEAARRFLAFLTDRENVDGDGR